MPKYYDFMVAGYYLYFTSKCIVECMHVHASDKRLTEYGSAKFFVKANGDTEIMDKGKLSNIEIRKIRDFIKQHHIEMHDLWSDWTDTGYYIGTK